MYFIYHVLLAHMPPVKWHLPQPRGGTDFQGVTPRFRYHIVKREELIVILLCQSNNFNCRGTFCRGLKSNICEPNIINVYIFRKVACVLERLSVNVAYTVEQTEKNRKFQLTYRTQVKMKRFKKKRIEFQYIFIFHERRQSLDLLEAFTSVFGLHTTHYTGNI